MTETTQRTRLTLHDILCEVIDSKEKVYYDPPSHMQYPCIKYESAEDNVSYGDNMRFIVKRSWMITVIDPDPDSKIPVKLLERFPYLCRKDREYIADGLHHFVFRLYY